MRKRAGLTLVEMMAALAISAILTAAALSAMGRLWRSDAAGQRQEEKDSLRQGLGSLLESDFLHADRCRYEPNAIRLQCRSALEVKALERDHVPALVSYELRAIVGRTWLVRTQRVGQSAPFAELVAADVKALSLKVAGGVEIKDWKQLPPAVVVGVTMADGRLLEYTFRTR